MEVILLENIKSLGKIGDVVSIKRGYGRNYLIKYGKALKASKENIEIVNKKKAQLNEKNVALKKEAKKIYDIINNKNFKFSKSVKDNNELYGSIKPRELSKTMEDKGPKMINADYSMQGKVKNSLKDSRLMMNLGQKAGSPTMMIQVYSQIMQAAFEKGYGEHDTVAFYEVMRGLAGLDERKS